MSTILETAEERFSFVTVNCSREKFRRACTEPRLARSMATREMASFTVLNADDALAVDPIPVDVDEMAKEYDALPDILMGRASNVVPSESMVTARAVELKRLTPLNSLDAVALMKL